MGPRVGRCSVQALPAIATPTTVTCAIGGVTSEDGNRLVIEIGAVSSLKMPSGLGTIPVPPVPGTPGQADTAKHWQFEKGTSFNCTTTLRLTRVQNQTHPYLQGGDEMVTEGREGPSLYEGM